MLLHNTLHATSSAQHECSKQTSRCFLFCNVLSLDRSRQSGSEFTTSINENSSYCVEKVIHQEAEEASQISNWAELRPSRHADNGHFIAHCRPNELNQAHTLQKLQLCCASLVVGVHCDGGRLALPRSGVRHG